MRFCDKLPKLRKEQNLSQEQLADKLGVSRQAISKWESGSSYPSMDTMMQLCTVLNCTLEDLLDDGVIKEGENKTKENYNNYFNDFLNFVTRTYNMFCAMSAKQVIKSLFELCIMAILLLIVGAITEAILSFITREIFGFFPFDIGYRISSAFETIYTIALLVVGVIVFIHLFKIRYLDYYITIEDNTVQDKTIESPIEPEGPKEKIIIRDPKHSNFSFLKLLGKLFLYIIKFFSLFIILPAIFFFGLFIVLFVISAYHIIYSSIFIYIGLSLLGLTLLAYIFIELIYRFIFEQKQSFKRLFIMFISSLAITAIGIGLSLVTFINFEYKEGFKDLKTETQTEYLEVNSDKDLYMDSYSHNIEYIVDNNQNNMKVEITHLKGFDYSISDYESENTKHYYIHLENDNPKKLYKLVLDDLKQKQVRNYSEEDFIKAKVYLSQENYDKLTTN